MKYYIYCIEYLYMVGKHLIKSYYILQFCRNRKLLQQSERPKVDNVLL